MANTWYKSLSQYSILVSEPKILVCPSEIKTLFNNMLDGQANMGKGKGRGRNALWKKVSKKSL